MFSQVQEVIQVDVCLTLLLSTLFIIIYNYLSLFIIVDHYLWSSIKVVMQGVGMSNTILKTGLIRWQIFLYGQICSKQINMCIGRDHSDKDNVFIRNPYNSEYGPMILENFASILSNSQSFIYMLKGRPDFAQTQNSNNH